MISKREARSIIRKTVKRVPEGEEIRHLNIMPMMDMMTILLVAMIFQASTSSLLSVSNVDMPGSLTHDETQEKALVLTVTTEAILVEGSLVRDVPMSNGKIDASAKEGGALGISVPRLSQYLGNFRKDIEAEMQSKGKEVPKKPEVMLVADRKIPYITLISVIQSARSEPANYRSFRLIVLEASAPGAGS